MMYFSLSNSLTSNRLKTNPVIASKHFISREVRIDISIMVTFLALLMVANLASTNLCKKPEKWLKPWHMGTHERPQKELSNEYQHNRVKMVFKNPYPLDESSLSYIIPGPWLNNSCLPWRLIRTCFPLVIVFSNYPYLLFVLHDTAFIRFQYSSTLTLFTGHHEGEALFYL